MNPNCSRILRLTVLIASLLPCAAVAQTYSVTEVIAYHDNTAKWVMGQAASVTCMASVPASTVCDGDVVSQTAYDTTYAVPLVHKSFGRLQQTLTYDTASGVVTGQLGTLKTVKDGNNNVTTYSNWKRGIPQTIRYPATPDSPAGAVKSAMVNDSGWILSTTDENGYTTSYGYDAMGRLTSIAYPTGDTTAWNTTTQIFQPVNVAEYSIPAGHWRQTVSTGNGYKITYFDALWRPLLTKELDATNGTAETLTRRFQRFTYDHEGRLTFTSYPGTTDALSSGIWTEYDALGRTTSVTQDSELGQLTTLTAYAGDSAGAYTRVTDPRGIQTVTRYQMFDQPTYEFPVLIDIAQNKSERAAVDITRNVFGKSLSIRRRNNTNTVSLTRSYTYNAYQELCRSQEPETGNTFFGYDGAGNLVWSASGYSTTTPGCMSASSVAARRADRTYDARNRIKTLSFPDGRGNQAWAYAPDGLPASITTYASAFDTYPIVNSYTYNRRRLLTGESLRQVVIGEDWNLSYVYNVNGHLASQSYPDGQIVAYMPNALGQPTQVGSYATGVSYYANGAIKQFTYGNGIVHSLIQNARQLPERSYDCAVAGTNCISANRRLDLSYAYDVGGNVSGITDNRDGQQTRSMVYDGLDRLTQATSPMFGVASYSYNALDNLTSVKVTGGSQGRDHTYVYDAENRLGNIKNSVGGATVVGIGYDLQGNIANRNGILYDFDFGNRLREVAGKEVGYTYDGHGRRVRAASGYTNPRYRTFQYSSDGRLVYEGSTGNNSRTSHFYLAGSLIASRTTIFGIPGGQPTVAYSHTDALGTPIVMTDASKAITSIRRYEPYGLAVNEAAFNRIGFTGHVEDAATGLTYMQQRYYDPACGCFLSVDPIAAYSNGDMRFFNRYAYAFNNPYRFTDPDGRQSKEDNGNFWVGTLKAVRDTIAPIAHAIADPSGTNIDPSYDRIGPGSGQVEQGGYKFGSALMVAEGARGLGQGTGGLAGAAKSGSTVVTPATVDAALAGSTMQTTQRAVSLPVVQRYVNALEGGSTAPPIKVADGVIVDGNHRFVAGRIVGQEPAVQSGTLSPSQARQVRPIQEIKVDPADWGNK